MEDIRFPIITLEPADFPHLLAEIPDGPKTLYLRGTLPPTENSLLAVVGSRHCSAYGKEATKMLIKGLASYPITIVSGLALGIDGIAHEAALDANLHTLAVPGSGVHDDVLYPPTHRRLAKKILESGGGILSEYEPLFTATTWAFPRRNRIMAGMSHATLIVEAGEKSGTLITARLALDYNRDVLVIPGSIFSRGSYGPHMLLRDGATPITNATDILEVLHIKPHATETTHHTFARDTVEHKILAALETPLQKDALIRILALPIVDTQQTITLLELGGYIREEHGVIMRITDRL